MPRTRQHYFDGKELRDAEAPMILPVLDMDKAAAQAVKSGSVNDPDRFKACVIAQSCIRTFGHDAKVRIMRRSAWVSLPGEKYALRFAVNGDAYEMLSNFDMGKPIDIGTFIVLSPPTTSRSLKATRKYINEYRQRPGSPQGGRERKTNRKQRKTDPLHGVVRNGSYVTL